MSGSGGYYKYRCKYWLTFNCPNWVWVNDAPCASCLAKGRDNEISVPIRTSLLVREFLTPRFEDDDFLDVLKEVITAGEVDSGWVMNSSSKLECPTSTEPAAVRFMATNGIGGSQHQDLS
ncbi:hypothetical protein CJF32_00010106 [Rutstroemia sp. NJR-2017a WRK4]|nr:hypothetical protein CJF32_00010106 [Rutstroemia sp. NJR-2017a WRK4]